MTNAIGVVITDHIVAGRLEDHRLAAKPLRFPTDPGETDALAASPPANWSISLPARSPRSPKPGRSTPSASPFPALFATELLRTRRT